MSNQNNGGPAFPQVKTKKQYSTDIEVHSIGGMSLRDYFAASALQGLIGRNWQHLKDDAEIVNQWAKSSYIVADALLAAREVQP